MSEENGEIINSEQLMQSDDGYGYSNIPVPPTAEAAWLLELIQVRLDSAGISKKFKMELLMLMAPYLNLSGMSNISRGQVIEFIMGYDKIWTKYRIYMNPDKFDADLIFLKDWIKEMFVLMLNKSIEGWQGNNLFIRRSTYDIKQKREDMGEKAKRFFGKKQKVEEE